MKIRFQILVFCAVCASVCFLGTGKTFAQTAAESITAKDMYRHLDFITADELKGREAPSPELKIVAKYIESQISSYGLLPIMPDGSYFQQVPIIKRKSRRDTSKTIEIVGNSQNVVAFVEGTDPVLKSEYVAFSAHYDHMGMNSKGEIWNGADDDGSGVVVLLELAEAFALNPTKRSVLFVWHTAEERGLVGSKYFSDNSPVPIEKISVLLNHDMVGRLAVDSLYIVGSNMLSSELHQINEEMNDKYVHLGFDHSHNTKDDPERWYYRSDHYMYARYGIPSIFYTGPDHEDYHKPTDTIEKINFPTMVKIARLNYFIGVEIGNRKTMLKLDMDPDVAIRGKRK